LDTFNLHWPGGDATLHTDGTRCRISWRAANGMGGSIENNDQAKKRAAQGLSFAPALLDELRQAGHGALAGEIEQLAPPAAPKTEPVVKPRVEKPVRAEKPVAAKPAPATKPAAETKPAASKSKRTRIARWLETLEGSGAFETCGARRASKWHHGKTWPDGLELKPPQGGKGEWVLKIAADETAYFSAESFRGVCAALASRSAFANDAFFAAFLDGCKALRQKEVQLAREHWDESA
jgi:hypothetical protein